MSLPVTVPFTFGNATTTQSLSSLDTNFTTITNSVNGLTNGASQINVASISATGTANSTTFLRGDGSWISVSAGGTVTSVNANSTISGFSFTGGPVTTSGTVTLTGPAPGASGNVLASDGTSWTSTAGSYPLTSGTSVTASNTSVTFTSIPSWVKRVTINTSGLSTNGTSRVIVQLGAGNITATGYLGATTQVVDASTPTGLNFSTGFLTDLGANAAAIRYGQIVITLLTGNTWVEAGIVSRSDSATTATSGGSIALSGTLDRVRITTVNGTDGFDAGTINILYE